MVRTLNCPVCNKAQIHTPVVQSSESMVEIWLCTVCGIENDRSPDLLEPRRGPIRPVRQATPQIHTHDYEGHATQSHEPTTDTHDSPKGN